MRSHSAITSPDYHHFKSIPWCAAHLEEKGDTLIDVAPGRLSKRNLEDYLFSRTFNTKDTIPAFLAIYDLPPPNTTSSTPSSSSSLLRVLVSLSETLCGFPSTVHGGIVATILDEVTGMFFPINKQRGALPNTPFMTASLLTTFIRPVPGPGTFLCRARIDRIEGRKVFVVGTIEDEAGTVLAKGDALFVAIREKL
ncbi:hypothetical protein SODALDRAFT_338290 [Sodiomyces alkalinus F11]|uniref:Thioesterase domain-containing protein n=1 Tax=Sodiomyces alkalinus (strain CBS 110278 / VKM F-3762 / F11) TaxID=1314773 RepID=A0A3N2Q1N4_SODAK|nr:hypothetical protein SODALDRAFT_338290 [Sodiomyces alkalinus F11]ROT40525.1 hypothetical protein SODALDRAFT_338290 [Sodiomyces alkalinus F11]